MCCAVGDSVALQSALERFEEIDYTFSGSREGKLLKARAPLTAVDNCLAGQQPKACARNAGPGGCS